jgi:plastocyanin
MRKLLNAVLLIFLGLLVAPAWARGEVTSAFIGTEVSGNIRLVQAKSRKPGKDASGVVVWLDPLDGLQPVRLGTSRKTYRMVQHHKQFHPHLLVVPLDSVVVFPNLDPWLHNVFSLYSGTRFDLGLYEAGADKKVRFDRPGASYIFCNIHPEMMAVILTVDTPFYTISDKAGHWSIPDVPLGRYRLHVWYENAKPAALHALERVVEVGNAGVMLATLSLRVTTSNLIDPTGNFFTR